MPVVPSYYSTRSYYPRSTPSSSLLLNRTTSLDRSSYASSYNPSGSSGYGSSYSSSSYSSASKPPRPSYSSSYYYDTYKSRRETSSPTRSSTAYTSRNSSDSRDSEGRTYEKTIGQRSVSDASSRYASSTVSSRLRDNSSSRDSGYGSRLTSRDRSLDIKNGNTFDTKAYGPSPSSYATNYRWERPNKSKEKSVEIQVEDELKDEKINVSDRIRNFESIDDDDSSAPSSSSRSATSSAASRNYLSDEVAARRKRDEDNISARRQRLGLSPIRKSRSKTPDVSSHRKYATPERNGNEEDDEEDEPQKSVSELRRRYDTTNHNGYASSTKDDDESADDSVTSAKKVTPTIRCDSPETSASSTSRRRTDSGTYSSSRDSPPFASKYGTSDYSRSSRYSSDGTRNSYLESPSSSRRNKDTSPQSRSPEGRGSASSSSGSALTNGYKVGKYSLALCFAVDDSLNAVSQSLYHDLYKEENNKSL